MAKNNIEVRTNFTSALANITTLDELKNVANIIRDQLVNAVNARIDEIAKGTQVLNVVAEVTATPAVQPQTETKKSTTAKAKEVAAKMKAQTTTPKPEPKAKTESKSDDDALIAITDTAAIKKLGLTFEKYNDRCWVLRGETKPLRKVLKEQFKGVFNGRLSGGEGWVFRNENAQECANALGIKVKVA